MSLILSTYLGKFDEVKNLVENEKQDVNQTDDYGDSALHVAVTKGRFEFVKYLVEKGASVNARNKAGSTPLHKTALAPYDKLEIARYLISKNADTNAKNDSGLYAEDLITGRSNISLILTELLLGKNLVTIKVPVNKDLHGKLIGKAGSRLMELRFETKTSITIPTPDENSNEITVKGRQESVELARKKILQAVSPITVYRNDDYVADPNALTTTTRIPIAKDRLPRIIGKGGSKIREIIGNTGVQVVIPSNDAKHDDPVRISGPVEDVNTVVKAIMQISSYDNTKPKLSQFITSEKVAPNLNTRAANRSNRDRSDNNNRSPRNNSPRSNSPRTAADKEKEAGRDIYAILFGNTSSRPRQENRRENRGNPAPQEQKVEE